MSSHDNHSQTRTAEPVRPALLARFIGNRKGTTAIEFTILLIPFILLVFAILESCVAFAGQQLLANATDEVARQIRTGQIRAENITETSLHNNLCAKLEILVSQGCPGLVFDLESYGTFAEAANVRTQLTADDELDTTGFGVHPGGSATKNMLRVYYEWPVMTDLMARYMSNLKGGKILLFASVTWQNEPF
jgi:Flp pilus assembly protein TadG